MIQYVSVQQVLIAALLVLSTIIVAHMSPVLHMPFVEHLSVHVQEAPTLERQVRYRILSVSYSPLEMVSPVKLVEPNRELGIANSGRPKSVKFSDFGFIGEEMCSCMSCNGCP
jgi:hypothetical protein